MKFKELLEHKFIKECGIGFNYIQYGASTLDTLIMVNDERVRCISYYPEVDSWDIEAEEYNINTLVGQGIDQYDDFEVYVKYLPLMSVE
jgi:hypothetical protein